MLIPCVCTYRPIQYTSAFSKTLSTQTAALTANYTVVQKLLPKTSTLDAYSGAGSYVRITIPKLVSPALMSITGCYIGLSATTGTNSAWNNSSQVQVTFNGGNTSVTVGSVLDVVSDNIALVVDGTKAISVAFNISSFSQYKYVTGLSSNYITYTKSGVSEAGAALGTRGASYTTAGTRLSVLSKLEIGS